MSDLEQEPIEVERAKAVRQIYTAYRLAVESGIPRTTLDRWIGELPNRNPDAGGSPMYWVSDLITYLRRKNDPGGLDPQQEKARLDLARREKIELELAEKRKELIPVEEAAREVETVLAAVRRVVLLSGLPAVEQDKILKLLVKEIETGGPQDEQRVG